MMAHFAVRGLMHEAALKADADPDQLSFLHAVRVVRRKLAAFNAIPPSAAEDAFMSAYSRRSCKSGCVSSRGRRNPRGVKRKMSNFPLRPRHAKPLRSINIEKAIRILK